MSRHPAAAAVDAVLDAGLGAVYEAIGAVTGAVMRGGVVLAAALFLDPDPRVTRAPSEAP